MDNRTKNGTRNIAAGLINRITNIALPFITRTLIVYVLGEKYLGLNGLFTSILMVLNLSELGFGSALTFCMYEPIAKNDNAKICSLLLFYRKVNRFIGCSILFIGALILPFLRNIIRGEVPSDINIYILYLIFLINTVVSYFFYAHKKALLEAYQRNDILSNINSLITLISHIVQIIILILFENFYLFVLVYPLFSILDNLYVDKVTKKRYPQLYCNGTLDKDTLSKIKEYVKGIALQKFCSVSRNSFDNIVISIYLGLTSIAIYGNYFYVMSAIHGFLYQIPNSIRATIGNSVVSEPLDKNYDDFNAMYLIYAWLNGWCMVCLLCLFQPFMYLWMGEKLMFPLSTVILLCFYFILLGLSDIIALYKDAAGLWWYGRYRVVIEAIANFFLNFLLGWMFGINGVLMATILTITFIGHGYGGYIVFKYYFKGKSFIKFVWGQLQYIIIIGVVGFLTYNICILFKVAPIQTLVVRTLICLVIPNCLFLLLFRYNCNYIGARNLFLKIIKSVK